MSAPVTFARPDKCTKSQSHLLSPHPHCSSPKCIWTPCTFHAPPAMHTSYMAGVRSPTTQSSACSEKKMHKRSVTGYFKMSCAAGAPWSKSSQTTASLLLLCSATWRRSTTSSTFASVATTCVRTALSNARTSTFTKHSSKQATATSATGHKSPTQYFGPSA
jgi:hypothetical protein